MTENGELEILIEIRNWIRAASFSSVRGLLESGLTDAQSRAAYQLLDGNRSIDQVRVLAKMSPNRLTVLSQRWTAMGLMEITVEKRKKRLFDLRDFGLLETEE